VKSTRCPPYWAGKNVFEVTLSGVLLGAGSTILFSGERTGVAYDPVSKKLFFSDDDLGRVFIVEPGLDRVFGTEDDIVTYFSTRAFGSQDPEDIVFDSLRGHLLVVDGDGTEVYDISPGVNGVFDLNKPKGRFPINFKQLYFHELRRTFRNSLPILGKFSGLTATI
jgi:DNA-binding beta-propeller fold protein YncE